jgi:hypothetical protein
MRFSRARYVTLCQQSLVTAAVLAVGVSAAGVKTLDIVPQPGPIAGAQEVAPGGLAREALADHGVTRRTSLPGKARVDAAPVTPTVREVKVTGISTRAQQEAPQKTGRQKAPGASTGKAAPDPNQREAPTAPQRPTHETTPTTKRLVALSDPQPVTGYATVGVTWKQGVRYTDDLGIEVRTKKDGTWSAWTVLGHDEEDGPDSGSSELDGARSRPGTDALVIGDVDQVQMRAETSDGTTPPDLELAVIDPGVGKMTTEAPAIDTSKLPGPQASAATSSSDAAGQPKAAGVSGAQDTAALSAMKVAPKPYIYSRAQWGANEKIRDQSQPSMGTVKAGFIHHTVNANDYTSEQVPALLRGIYAYHTQSRGWRDIGYNFLVDRFGRIWEGRYGGVGNPVVGAHTLGYNEVSFAMSAIGNFDIAAPPQAVSDAYARLFAWKLSLYNIQADAPRIFVKDRYMQAINGHRDVGQTACPGRYLYAKIPAIRVAAQRIQDAAQSGTAPTTQPPPPATPPPAPAPAPAPNPDVFTSPTQTPRPATTQPSGLLFPRSLNLAGDATPELVLKSSTGAVQVFPTGGQTGFLPAVSTPGAWSGLDQVVAVGDLNGDGKGDVLGRTRADKIARVYLGDGAGHVSTAGVNATPTFRYANMIIGAGDWNRDGRNDAFMRDTKTGWLMLVPGLGNGRFGRPVLVSKSWKNFTATGVAGDLTGDGRADLVAISRDGFVYAAAATTTGGLSRFSKRQRVGTRFNALVGGARDMNGDGFGDVVVRSASTGEALILPGARGTFAKALGPFDAARGLGHLSAGQMTGGSQPDLVGTNSAGTALLVVANNGLVNLRAPLRSTLTRADITQLLTVGDWNRDGRGDVITRQTGGDSLVLRPGLGNGGFGTPTVMSRGWKGFTNLAAVGDVTGDSRPDLAGKTATGKTLIFPGNGVRGFKAPLVAPNFLKSYNQIGLGFWKPQRLPGSAYISSDGSFVPFKGTGVGDLADYDWVIGPGDVDGDGRSDLVARDAAGTLWLLPGTDIGYGTRRVIATGFSGYSLGG